VFISSTLGSIAKMTEPHSVTYRASKSALNAVARAASLEWNPKGVVTFVMHPGWVKTDMGGPGADIDVATSVTGIREVIQRARPESNGGFFDYTGQTLPW
jgi:NAD(P)-dependent dehydrogenase (short-subunit alcohol dehydrogenase family)